MMTAHTHARPFGDSLSMTEPILIGGYPGGEKSISMAREASLARRINALCDHRVAS